MGQIPAWGMGCALHNAEAEQELSSKTWIHLGSLDHLEVWCSVSGSGRCAECLCLQHCTESRA